MTNEKTMRTREEQLEYLSGMFMEAGAYADYARISAESHIKEAEMRAATEERERCAKIIEDHCEMSLGAGGKELSPRRDGDRNGLTYAQVIRGMGAAQARAEDAKGQEPLLANHAHLMPVRQVDGPDYSEIKGAGGESIALTAYPEWLIAALSIAYTRPSNVAALEARIEELEAQLKKVTTPTWYCSEGEEEGGNEIASAVGPSCPFNIEEVDGWAPVKSFWVFYDNNYDLHIFNTEEEAVSALAAMKQIDGETP